MSKAAAVAVAVWWVASAIALYFAAPAAVSALLWLWFWALVASGTFVVGVAAGTLWRL